MSNDIPNAFSQLPMVGRAWFIACLIHAETIHARDAYTANSDAADGVRLRARNETVHRLSGLLKAVLGERVSADHHDCMVGLIERSVSGSQRRRGELARWIAEAASHWNEGQRRIVRQGQFPLI